MSKRRVLVTGASKGIGAGIASQLASDGFDVVVHYGRDKDGAAAILDKIMTLQGGSDSGSHLIQFNVRDRQECKAKIEQDIEKFGAFYGVVNNAGITRDTAFPMMTGEDWDDVVETNLNSFYNVIHPTVMPMVRSRKGGRIVTMSSVSGMMGNRGQVNYSASKGGIIAASKALALELAKRKITVNCVAPGLIDTGMINDEIYEHAKDMIPLRRMGEVEEVAGAVSYLMSDVASYVTRQVISVNGGLV